MGNRLITHQEMKPEDFANSLNSQMQRNPMKKNWCVEFPTGVTGWQSDYQTLADTMTQRGFRVNGDLATAEARKSNGETGFGKYWKQTIPFCVSVPPKQPAPRENFVNSLNSQMQRNPMNKNWCVEFPTGVTGWQSDYQTLTETMAQRGFRVNEDLATAKARKSKGETDFGKHWRQTIPFCVSVAVPTP